MKLSGKKLSALLAGGIMLFSATSCSENGISGYSTISDSSETNARYEQVDNQTIMDDSEKMSKITPEQEQVLDKLKNYLESDIESEETIELGKDYDGYIESVYIDGRNIEIETIDGEVYTNEDVIKLDLSDINVDNLSIIDTNYITEHKSVIDNNTLESIDSIQESMEKFRSECNSNKKLELYLSNVSVHNEFKHFSNKDIAIDCSDVILDSSKISIEDCKNIWLYGYEVNDKLTNSIREDKSLERLILSSPYFDNYSRKEYYTFVLDNPKLKSVIVTKPSSIGTMYNFDFRKCSSLETFSLGNNTAVESLDGLSGLKHLKKVSFGGSLKDEGEFEILKSFEEIESDSFEIIETDNKAISKANNNNFIHDIRGIKNSDIEVLNISSLYHVDSDQLYEVVRTLPSLKEITGYEVNNAEMYSDELIKYCEEHSINHPFSEKSKMIKDKLKEIVSENTHESMSRYDKIKSLSEYIVTHMEYDKETFNQYFEDKEALTSDQIRKNWGENLYYTLFEGKGVCAGYSELTEALFTEAGIDVLKQTTVGHIYNIVKLDRYYQIDLTRLDEFISTTGLGESEYFSEISSHDESKYYMVPFNSDEAEYFSYVPYEATYVMDSYDKDTNIAEENLPMYGIAELKQKGGKQSNEKNLIALIGILSAMGIAVQISKSDIIKGRLVEHSIRKGKSVNRPIYNSVNSRNVTTNRVEEWNILKSKLDMLKKKNNELDTKEQNTIDRFDS